MAAGSLPTTSGWPLGMEPAPHGLSGVRGGSVSGFHDSYHRPGLPLRSGLPSSHPCPTSKVWAAEKSGSRYREVAPMERGGEPGEVRPPMPGLPSTPVSSSHRNAPSSLGVSAVHL